MMATAAAATTATVTTTAVVAAVTVQQALTLGVFATSLLIALLVLKELLLAYAAEARVRGSWRATAVQFYANSLNVAIMPLMFIFGLLILTKVAALL